MFTLNPRTIATTSAINENGKQQAKRMIAITNGKSIYVLSSFLIEILRLFIRLKQDLSLVVKYLADEELV